MPEAVVWIGKTLAAGAIEGSIAATVGSFLVTNASYVFVAGTMIYGQAAKRRAARQAKQQYLDSLESKTATGIAIDAPYKYVYGRDKVGCNIVAMLTSGTADRYRHLVCVFADHEVNQVHEVYVAGKPVGYANLVSSGTAAEKGWVTYNGDSEVQVIRGNVITFKLPAGYDNLVVKRGTDGLTFGTTLTLGTHYTVTNNIVTLTAYTAITDYIQLTFCPNSYYTTDTTEQSSVEFTSTYTLPVRYSNLRVLSQFENLTLMPGTDYTVVGTLITMIGIYTGATATAVYLYSIGTSRVKVDTHLGLSPDTVDAYLTSVSPGLWTANHKLSGHAYVVVTLDLEHSEFQGGPPDVQVECSGKKVYDPRTATTVWSDNPALVVWDYLRSPLVGISSATMTAVQQTYIDAANACDALAITVNGVSSKRYTFNGVVTSEETAVDVLEGMAQSMAGTVNGADWSIFAGVYTAPTLYLNHMDDVVGSLAIAPGLPRNDIYNTVKGRYTGLETKYIATDIKPYVDAAYKSLDGEELVKEMSFPYTNNMQRCHNLSAIALEDTRNGLTITADFSYKAWRLRPGDRIMFTSPTNLLNMSNRVFRVTDKSFSFGKPVKLTLKEDASAIWDTAPTSQIDSILSSLLNWTAESTYATSIFGLTAASGDAELVMDTSGSITSRIRVYWVDTIGKSLSHVEVQYRKFDEDVWTSQMATGAEAATYISPVSDGEVYFIRARVVNTMFNSVGPWAGLTHTVIGKTAPPDNVDTFDVTIDANGTRKFNFAYTTTSKPLDFAGIEIRYMAGSVASPTWASMTKLHTGLVTQSPYDSLALYPGEYTFAIKAVDTTGNYSSTALVDVGVVLPVLPTGNVIASTNSKDGWDWDDNWFVTIGSKIGTSIEPGIGAWTIYGTTWATNGATTWDHFNTSGIIEVQTRLYFGSVVDVSIGLDVDFSGAATYTYSATNYLGSSTGLLPLTPDTFIREASEVQVTIRVDETAAASHPAIRSADVKAFNQGRYVQYVAVDPRANSTFTVEGHYVYLTGTDVAVIRSYEIQVNDPGNWTWEYTTRPPASVPPEDTPYIAFYKDGVPTVPASITLTVVGHGVRPMQAYLSDYPWN